MAKLGQSALDKADKAGGYLTGVFSEAIGHIAATVGDKAQTIYILNRINCFKKIQKELEAAGMTENLQRIPNRQALPLLEAMSLEDEDEFQNVWAKYVANALNPTKSDVSINRRLTDVIRSLEAEDLQVLRKLFEEDLRVRRGDAMELTPDAFGIDEVSLDLILTRFVSVGLFTFSIGDYLSVSSDNGNGWPCWIEVKTSTGEYRSAPLLMMLQRAIG